MNSLSVIFPSSHHCAVCLNHSGRPLTSVSLKIRIPPPFIKELNSVYLINNLNSLIATGKSRQVIFYLSIIELKLRYRGTFLGFFWSVLEPLAQLGILYLVFSALRSADETFVIYLFSGLIMVHLFTKGTTQAMNSLVTKKSIIVSLNIPKIIFPLSTFLTNLYMVGIEFVIFFLFIVVLGFELSLTIFLLPAIVFLLIVFTCGMALILSIVRLYFKDVQSIWGIVVISLIFITPVFWEVKDMPEDIAQIFLLNPLAMIMEMGHEVILYHTVPSLEETIYSVSTSFATLFVGWILFKKIERKIVEKL